MIQSDAACLSLWKPFCTLCPIGNLSWPSWPVVSPPPCFALACIPNYLSLLIFWYEHWEIVRLKKKNGHRKCWKRSAGTGTNKVNFIAKGQWRGSCWSLIIVSPSPRVGLSQINNLCNMLTVCLFKQPNGYWHLNHYCIKIIFCGCMLCFCFTDSIQQSHIESQCRMPPSFRWMELVYLYYSTLHLVTFINIGENITVF